MPKRRKKSNRKKGKWEVEGRKEDKIALDWLACAGLDWTR